MRRRLAGAGLALGAAAMASSAQAAGGAHVVDDDAVETPGTCHFEQWVSFASGRSRLANVGVGCTPMALPTLELGGFVTHSWGRGSNDTVIGLTPKLMLRSELHGLGIGVSGSLGYGVDRHRLETASVTVPLTVPVSRWLRTNFNLGWQWSRLGRRSDLFLGGQAEIALSRQWNLMAEAFTLDRGKARGQLGLRWTPGAGRMDVDLIAGRYVDGVARNAITLGLTLRR
jgi:hypothetical protein